MSHLSVGLKAEPCQTYEVHTMTKDSNVVQKRVYITGLIERPPKHASPCGAHTRLRRVTITGRRYAVCWRHQRMIKAQRNKEPRCGYLS